jgi:hypothetical protein
MRISSTNTQASFGLLITRKCTLTLNYSNLLTIHTWSQSWKRPLNYGHVTRPSWRSSVSVPPSIRPPPPQPIKQVFHITSRVNKVAVSCLCGRLITWQTHIRRRHMRGMRRMHWLKGGDAKGAPEKAKSTRRAGRSPETGPKSRGSKRPNGMNTTGTGHSGVRDRQSTGRIRHSPRSIGMSVWRLPMTIGRRTTKRRVSILDTNQTKS